MKLRSKESVLARTPQKKEIPPDQIKLFNFMVRAVGDEVQHPKFGKGIIVDPVPYPGTSFRRVSFSRKVLDSFGIKLSKICVFERSLL